MRAPKSPANRPLMGKLVEVWKMIGSGSKWNFEDDCADLLELVYELSQCDIYKAINLVPVAPARLGWDLPRVQRAMVWLHDQRLLKCYAAIATVSITSVGISQVHEWRRGPGRTSAINSNNYFEVHGNGNTFFDSRTGVTAAQTVDVSGIPDHSSVRLPGLSWSPDFRTVTLRGEEFTLTPAQAQVIEQMVNHSPAGPRDLAQDTILVGAELRSASLADIFKHSPAWKKLIVPGEAKGTYRLGVEPEPTR